MLKRLLLTIAILGFSSCVLADSAFDGKWTAEVVRPAPAGNQTLAITFNTSQGKVTGSMVIQGAGEVPIDWGMVKGDLNTASKVIAHRRRRVSFPLRQFSNCVSTTATTSSSTGKYRLCKH